MINAMVRYFARDTHKVTTALILLVFVCTSSAGTNTIVILKAKPCGVLSAIS
jgi:hypothetical protein